MRFFTSESISDLMAGMLFVRQKPTTPKNLSSAAMEAIKAKIGTSEDAVFINVTPEPGTEFNDCHGIVRDKVSSDGGRVVHGWLIWEQPGAFIEGTFHSVWENPDGNVVDLTPQADGEKQIAFIPDPRTRWVEVPVKSHRLALTTERSILAR